MPAEEADPHIGRDFGTMAERSAVLKWHSVLVPWLGTQESHCGLYGPQGQHFLTFRAETKSEASGHWCDQIGHLFLQILKVARVAVFAEDGRSVAGKGDWTSTWVARGLNGSLHGDDLLDPEAL